MGKSRPFFPPVFDSTMIASLCTCPQKFYRTYVQHWKPQGESVHLHAGKAFATGIEAARKAFYVEKQSPDDAVAAGVGALLTAYGDFHCPEDSAKSATRMAGALEHYFSVWRLGIDSLEPMKFADGGIGVEYDFAIPLPLKHPVTGDPILYSGRMDCLGLYNGVPVVVDEKTTSSLGASWLKQWEMRAQFTGYIWAAREQGIKIDAALIRGISILKTKYDTAEVLTYRPKHMVDMWFEQVCRNIERAMKMWEEGWWDYNFNHGCIEYGTCSLTDICRSENPDTWLPMSFTQRVWNPLLREEVSPEEWEAMWVKPAQIIAP